MAQRRSKIEYLVIWRNLNQEASESEQIELQEWLAQDKKHGLLYDHLKLSGQNEFSLTESHIHNQWLRLNRRIEKKRINLKKWLNYAAAILLPIAIVLGVVYFSEIEVRKVQFAHQIMPGSSKAVLQLANGDLVKLGELNETSIKDEQGQVIGVDSVDVLTCSSKPQKQITFNSISTPRGGEYQLVLVDGTKVYLNSESSLTYPLSFSGPAREVYLTGEAYFDVTTNKAMPFIVKTDKSSVSVFGTQFNVMSYADDRLEQTTLVEGCVSVFYNDQEIEMKPGQQVQISDDIQRCDVHEVDTTLYVDWKNGIFRFEDMALKDVAVRLSRWYDVNFFFANEEIKKRKVTGAIKRSTDFKLFMSLIEKSAEVEITISENDVLVKGKY